MLKKITFPRIHYAIVLCIHIKRKITVIIIILLQKVKEYTYCLITCLTHKYILNNLFNLLLL